MSTNVQSQVICYEVEESSAVGFWFDHFYFAKCTDWEATNSKLFADDNDYIDFNGGSSVDFTNIFVEEDGDYTVIMKYGIGYANPTDGALLTINVNGQLAEQLVLYRLTEPRPASIEFTVELWAEWDNVIQLKQERDWPILLGIQLSDGSGIAKTQQEVYSVYASNGMIGVKNLMGSSYVQVYSIDGKLISSVSTIEATVNLPAKPGFYIVKINGTTQKVVVR